MEEIRCALESDREFWFRLDRHLAPEAFARKVRERQAYICLADGVPAGLPRYGLFWDSIPFCNLLYVAEGSRGQGLGRALMQHWEGEMKRLGCNLLMTSTQADESAQHFYRKLGYRDCGGLVLGTGGQVPPLELVLCKEL